MNTEGEILASVFAARIMLAKKTREQAAMEAATEWEVTQEWLKSNSQKKGGFLWFCEEFDLDHGAVRRAVREAQAKAVAPAVKT
jgi:hypothetical protein